MKSGFVSMPLSGHLNPMTALARKHNHAAMKSYLLAFPMWNHSLALRV
jgi:hypothetical protein